MTFVSGYTQESDTLRAAEVLPKRYAGSETEAVFFFCGHHHDGEHLATLGRALPNTAILGCSTNGPFSDVGFGESGVAAFSMGPSTVRRAASAIADYTLGIERGVNQACDQLECQLGRSLSQLSHSRFVWIALVEGATGQEETFNEFLGNRAHS